MQLLAWLHGASLHNLYSLASRPAESWSSQPPICCIPCKACSSARLWRHDAGCVLAQVTFRVQDVSAVSGEGLREGLQWVVDEVRRSDRAVLLRQRRV